MLNPTGRPSTPRCAPLLAACLFLALPAAAQNQTTIREGLAAPGVIRSGRSLVRTDPVEAALVRHGHITPAPGEPVSPADDAPRWQPVEAGQDGWFTGVQRGYVAATITREAAGVALLRAPGSGVVYVNGVPRAGDPYASGLFPLPVSLRAGENTIILSVGQRARLMIEEPRARAMVLREDSLVPNIIRGQSGPWLGAVVVVNASDHPARALVLQSRASDDAPWLETPVPPLGPCATRKSAFTFNAPDNATRLTVRLLDRGGNSGGGGGGGGGGEGEVLDEITLELQTRASGETHTRTFRSAIDGSVQYYAVVPRAGVPADQRAGGAMILSLHGASVEATSQAGAYAAKSWATIVCPTNRRPFGFDWEDWGRLDGLEVLAHATAADSPDPSRLHVTGHSMGGHGAWQFGALFPGLFAATAPSAGWCSFWTYTAGPRPPVGHPVEQLLRDACATSNTEDLIENFAGRPVAILHGDADATVPVREAREMRERLRTVGVEPIYHEQPGAGHWWEDSDEPGAECLDWPGFADLFAHARLPRSDEVRRVRFVTFNTSISHTRHWLTIHRQQHSLRRSSADILADPHRRRFTGTTHNIDALTLSAAPLLGDGAARIRIDASDFDAAPVAGVIHLARTPDGWQQVDSHPPAAKHPGRAGPFKEGIRRAVVMVYATGGTDEENAWAAAKARYDHETWHVRGNGACDIVSDADFLAGDFSGRDVLLYGHAEMNRAWHTLLSSAPFTAARGQLTVADGTRLNGDNLALLALFPRPGCDTSSVVVIAGTGPEGMRLNDRAPTFLSGVGIPDLVVMRAHMLQDGAPGVIGAGFFGPDWSVQKGRFEWRDRE
ncbi:MAG: prolyl oligopeptidase family serine peptidase [Phycisphaeraceae bacterium]|nr:prolyl oligopeptidase family serine peptidase [Phycisphaeraceae bacterium]